MKYNILEENLMFKFGPRDRQLTTDEETVEVLEIIEDCDNYSDLDDDEEYQVYDTEY